MIRDLAVILGVAGLVSLLFQRIRQPVVLGYIIAGILIGPYTPPFQLVEDIPNIQTWAELGVIFLMFTLGLEFSFRKLASVGFSAGVTASTEVLFFLPVGYFVGQALGWKPMDRVFLGAMLTISSTTIIIKALDELKLKKHRFAELIFGVLIVEDLFAILLLVALGTIAVSKTISVLALLTAALKLILVVGGWFITGYFVVPRFMRYVGRIGSDEMLTILSLGLCLSLVVFANSFDYSTALGAFIMGSILAESPVLPRIERSMASLRDVFGAIFFVSIGMLIDPRVLWEQKTAVAILCAVTIAGKILSTATGALISGQSVRNSVQVGFGLAQIGEFSFIIAQLGMGLKVTSPFVYPIAVAVSLVTTFTTPYLIRVSGRAATAFERLLPPRLSDMLNNYALHAEARRSGAKGGQSLFQRPLLRWLLNGLTTSVIFVLCSEYLVSLLEDQTKISFLTIPVVGWSCAIALAAPFVWGMLMAFRSQRPSVLFQLLTLIWLSALSGALFPSRHIMILMAIVLAAAFGLFYRSLERSYQWLEESFLANFEGPQRGHGESSGAFNHLAPWDAHLVTMEIHPNSPLVLQRIRDAALRVRYGVNIVAIQRGHQAIVTPMPEEVLLPRDALILLGTDEQVEGLRKELEDPAPSITDPEPTTAYELRQLRLTNGSSFVGQSIRDSGIREKYHAMVVGIEREASRKINPDSNLKLESEDILWIAGERLKLDQLVAASAKRS